MMVMMYVCMYVCMYVLMYVGKAGADDDVEEDITPFYRAMVQELGWKDCLGKDYGPTSITLSRR